MSFRFRSKFAIHHFPARIIRPPLAGFRRTSPSAQELGIFPLQFAAKLDQQLADARLLNRKVQPDKAQRRRFLAETVAAPNGPTISLLPM